MAKEVNAKRDISGLFIPAGLFLGAGIGMIAGQFGGGILLGLGLGFVGMIIAKMLKH